MVRINLFLDNEEDQKVERFKNIFEVSSKEDVIKKMIDDFPEEMEVLI